MRKATSSRSPSAMADLLSRRVHHVAEALNKKESKTLLYLCSDLLLGQVDGDDWRGALASTAGGGAILVELMFLMKRFDLLKKVLGSSRQEAEALVKRDGVVSKYRILMLELSENLDTDDLNSLIFLLSRTVPTGHLKQATSFLDVVIELEKLDKVSSERLELIEEGLRSIRRFDLLVNIHSYAKGPQIQQGAKRPVQNGGQPLPRPKMKFRPLGLPPPRSQMCHGLANLKLSVPERGLQHNQSPAGESYIASEPRGVCVIVDCIGLDGALMERTFQQLGFRTTLHSLLGLDETVSLLTSLCRRADLQRASSLVCCLLSRACRAHLLATDSEGRGLPLRHLRQLFDPQRCPGLAGRPKLFFTQSYVVSGPVTPMTTVDDEFLETDAVPFRQEEAAAAAPETVPTDADVLWSECSVGAQLLERRSHHSVYVRELSAALLRARERKSPLLDALTEVNKLVFEHNRRNPSETYDLALSHTLRKTLYL